MTRLHEQGALISHTDHDNLGSPILDDRRGSFDKRASVPQGTTDKLLHLSQAGFDDMHTAPSKRGFQSLPRCIQNDTNTPFTGGLDNPGIKVSG